MKLDGNSEAIRRDTNGHVGVDLAALCREAALQSIREMRWLRIDLLVERDDAIQSMAKG